MPSPVVTNVLVGSAILYTAPFGTAFPADTVAAGVTWGGSWTYIGGTEDGVTTAFSTNPNDIYIDEVSIPAVTAVGTATFEFRFNLSEDTLDSIKLSHGASGTLSTVVSSTGVAAKKKLVLSSTLTKLACGFEGVNAAGFTRRVFCPAVLSVGSVETNYRRAANNRSYPTVLRAVCDPSQIEFDDWTAAAAGP